MSERRAKLKICLLGDGAVGKTSLIRRFVHNEFDERYLYTFGTVVSRKDVAVEAATGERWVVTLLVWDIMGQGPLRERLIRAYLDGVHGVLAVADLTRPETIFSLRGWIDKTNEVADGVPLTVLGNKSDLLEDRDIAMEAVAALSDDVSALHRLTSARTGEAVEAAFQEIAERILDGTEVDHFAG